MFEIRVISKIFFKLFVEPVFPTSSISQRDHFAAGICIGLQARV